MLFNSLAFLIFFSFVYLIYWALGHKWRRGFLIFASLVFYGYWSLVFLVHFVSIVILNYVFYYFFELQGRKKALTWIVVLNLVNLFAFKYYPFFQRILTDFGFKLNVLPGTGEWILPLAISFYTFQMISFQVDVHRGDFKNKVSFQDFLLFILFFPQLIAGPILRAKDFLNRIHVPKTPRILFSLTGCWWIVFGLIKKVLIADQISPWIDSVYSSPGIYNAEAHWAAFYGFAVQIYCDFSGYTDIARGCALLLGYKLPPNFLAPYFSGSFREFWRRWHITLSTWLRDYLYIPLGGNRFGDRRTYLNLFITMLLGGIWHGANYTFIIWGAWHGILLGLERMIGARFPITKKLPKIVSILIVFHLVCFGWVFFRADSVTDAISFFSGLANITGNKLKIPGSVQWILLTFLVLHWFEYRRFNLKSEKWNWAFRYALPLVGIAVGFWVAGSVSGERSFIYFQF
ncbi:MBOAT family protein [Leptospira langatensis]|uniref:MBOAT family protein n=1 Tax=Leptospira langatensis TaxID=2484983 RepID=A0A5F1ZYE8_9LEPT|nr:MBOAT family O-acyltransferase [Leptospira langatensis]TGK00128.1 MBOAT family protein [Leptospira langatensis]TGL42762.1 MBOAT family protein [Leptospira langatensis]